ncbi:hypothetical protein C5E08_13810 [Rathayibacter iranicus]|uniref:Uncharacterized protein n=1 Tax=Rathayibacter iranicus TaxID=59737 RepID=A0AAD1AEQ3_9MICO|nr:hypothetical protein C7V51_14050 [Rathayibacter iranicus]PPI42509.1 hypothetical protein C5E09_12905 [Rathayibacter iranicus]PPI57925.1 hypothetical protein C5E08_13810 [Rathayibacter iranicus]PPI68861.1 hypothetical protein C5E01_12860 [Rathayibacter iranicus]
MGFVSGRNDVLSPFVTVSVPENLEPAGLIIDGGNQIAGLFHPVYVLDMSKKFSPHSIGLDPVGAALINVMLRDVANTTSSREAAWRLESRRGCPPTPVLTIGQLISAQER